MVSSQSRHLNIVQFLIDKGAELNTDNNVMIYDYSAYYLLSLFMIPFTYCNMISRSMHGRIA